MEIGKFIENIQNYANLKNEKPKAACEKSGAGYSLWDNLGRGRMPSIDRVEKLAHYLGTTVSVLIGEAEPSEKVMTLHDSAVVIQPDDFRHLSLDEMDMVLAYRQATAKERRTIDGILSEYKKGTTSEVG